MNTVNHEYYVLLEVAKLLKDAGFDWECETCYIGKSKHPYRYNEYFNWNLPRKYFEKDGSDNLFHSFINQKKTNNFISAPTLEIAQRWLRVVKGIHLYVSPILDEHKYVVTVIVDDLTWGQVNDNNGTSKRFNTYEEAQEAGIKKALEIILKK